MNRRLGPLATVLVLAASLAVAAPGRAGAADDVTLTLVAQPFTIAAGSDLTASFQVNGDLGPATPGSVPPTTSPATTAPAATAPAVAPTSSPAPVSVPTAPPAPVVEARVLAHRRIDDRAGLETAFSGDTGPVVARVTVPVSLTAAGGTTSFSLTVPTTTDPDEGRGLVLAAAGTYPITVALVVDGEVVATHDTFVERLPVSAADDGPAVHVAVVAGIDDAGPDPAPAELAAAREALDGIAAGAVALGGVMSVRLPPSVVSGLDDAALADLQTSLAGVELLSTPALALDPSSAVAAGQEDTFSRELRAGEDVLAAALPRSPNRRSAWLATTPLSAAAGATLREPLGFDLAVFEPDVYDDLEGSIGGFQDTTLGFDVDVDGGELLGVVTHPAGRWLDGRQLAARDMSGTDGAIAILAELRTTRRELGADRRRSAVLSTPAGASPDVGVLTALAGYASTTPAIELTTLSTVATATDVQDVAGREPESVTLPATAGTDLAERVERIQLTRINATGAGSMLTDQSRVAAWDDELDALLSTALSDDQVDDSLARISGEAQGIYECVVVPNPFTLTLTGRSSTLRLNLTNACAEDLRVVVRPSSSRLIFPNGDVARTLGANSVTEVEIEVESRSNGTSAIGIELLTPVGPLALGEPLVLTARVNALSGLGQLVTGGALLVLVSWWYGHFRRRRRVRRAMLGEVDNPVNVGPSVSPDAAEVSGDGGRATAGPVADHR